MRQPARVTPSNVQRLRDGAKKGYQAPRALQEQPGNRQASDYSTTIAYEPPKFAPHVTIDNSWPAPQHQEQCHVAPLHHAQPEFQQRPAYEPYLYGRSQSFYNVEDERRIDHLAQTLWKRFESSEAYKRYRGRQQKDEKAGQEQKWPDFLERAFFRAMVKYPPMGRRKILLKGKQRGRNELVADHIQEQTGHERSRKQVSSHIQVLKPFVEHDPYIMKWLSAPKEAGDLLLSTRHLSSHHTPSYLSGRRNSTYPAAASPFRTACIGAKRYHPSQMELTTVRKLKRNLDMFEPVTFSMFVQRKYPLPSGEQGEVRLHTYTQNIEYPRGPDIWFQDWQAFEQDYPKLARMNTQRSLDCSIIVADASLSFPTDSFNDQNNVELGISFICSSKYMSPTAYVKCRNTFYKDGKLVMEHSGHHGQFDVQFQAAGNGRGATTSMRFGSSFWARTLAEIASKLLKPSNEEGKDLRDEVSNIIRSISVVMEVVFISEHGNERILVMQWMFRQSSAATGRVSWRRIVLSSTPQYPDPKAQLLDSMYSYKCTTATQYAEMPASQSQIQPALQSPFEYNDSSSGSKLSSTTWATSISDGDGLVQSGGGKTFENDCEFSAGNINMICENDLGYGKFTSGGLSTNAVDHTSFNNSTFTFDIATLDVAQDPALEQFTQQWCDGIQKDMFESQPLSAVSAEASYEQPPSQAGDNYQAQTAYNDYNMLYD